MTRDAKNKSDGQASHQAPRKVQPGNVRLHGFEAFVAGQRHLRENAERLLECLAARSRVPALGAVPGSDSALRAALQ